MLPAFIHQLTGSSVWVGGLATLLAAASLLPQVVVARFVEPMARKKPVLLAAIAIRSLAWLSIGGMIAWLGPARPVALLTGMVLLLALFSAAGALGGVPYVDLVGRVIPRTHRGRFFASREAAGSLFALGSSALAAVLLKWSYPDNYAALFVGSGIFLAVASVGVVVMREPPAQPSSPLPWRAWFDSLREPGRRLLPLSVATWVTGSSLLAVPLYVVYARELGAGQGDLAWFIAAGVVGSLVANLVWARLVDRLGAWRMIQVCAATALGSPLLALGAPRLGWPVLVAVVGLAGATQAGRRVGFNSALLELAPAERRASYGATYAMLSLPVALMPLLGGVVARSWGYPVLFGLTAVALVAAVVVVSRRAATDPPSP